MLLEYILQTSSVAMDLHWIFIVSEPAQFATVPVSYFVKVL